MASIDRRPSGIYRARWREYPTGPQRSRHFSRKADAQRFLDGLRGDLVRGLYIDPASGRMPFRAYAEEWRAAQMHRPSTASQCEIYLRRHAYPTLGDRPIGSIRRSEIQAWVKDRSAVLAPGSVEVVYRWVATIFKAAVGDRLIASSPCVRINLPKDDRGEVTPLEVEAVEALAEAVPARYRALIVFAAGTGLRQGECFGLTVDRVDFLRRHVRVDRQLVAVTAGTPEFGPPKSQAGFRTVPMPGVVTEALAAHLATFGPGPENLVFTNSRGGPLRRNRVGEVWHRAAAAAALPTGATFHDLRHFYASLLIAHGCSVKAVQRRLGHQSGMETLDTYSHLWPDSDDETREAVDAILGLACTRLAQRL
jgi:integrase